MENNTKPAARKYKVVVSDTVIVPVEGHTNDDTGRKVAFKFQLVCERRKADELRDLMDSDTKVADLMKRVTKDWRGQRLVLNEDDTPADFNSDSFDALLGIATMAHVCFNSYLKYNGASEKKLTDLAQLLARQQIYVEGAEHAVASEVDVAAAALGLAPIWAAAPEEPEEVFLWPENKEVWDLFQSLSTQWNVGMQGPLGLRYEAVPIVMRMRRVKRSNEQEIFAKVQLMEAAMLAAWSEKKNG